MVLFVVAGAAEIVGQDGVDVGARPTVLLMCATGRARDGAKLVSVGAM